MSSRVGTKSVLRVLHGHSVLSSEKNNYSFTEFVFKCESVIVILKKISTSLTRTVIKMCFGGMLKAVKSEKCRCFGHFKYRLSQ